jgi:hypothetical protein
VALLWRSGRRNCCAPPPSAAFFALHHPPPSTSEAPAEEAVGCVVPMLSASLQFHAFSSFCLRAEDSQAHICMGVRTTCSSGMEGKEPTKTWSPFCWVLWVLINSVLFWKFAGVTKIYLFTFGAGDKVSSLCSTTELYFQPQSSKIEFWGPDFCAFPGNTGMTRWYYVYSVPRSGIRVFTKSMWTLKT